MISLRNIICVFCCVTLLTVTSVLYAQELRPFKSDGCSLFPDRASLLGGDWCECCFQHDLSYWRGGSTVEREIADRTLKECVVSKTGNISLARLMYQGVRQGGSPYFYTWYRWGYGWDFGRGYDPVTEVEEQQIEMRLKEYYENPSEPSCEK